MRNLVPSPLTAIIRAELLFNSRRIAPWALMALFAGNAALWWGSASVFYGWAPNSDYYIVRLYTGFSVATLPLFNAMLMGDAVLRDLRYEVAPLLLSKPVRRAQYLLGKFLGNYLTLAACGAIFALTLFVLQWAGRQGMVMLPWRIAPYAKFFVAFVLVPQLVIAAFCFTVGTLTRSAKLVYGLVILLYGLYIAVFATFGKNAPRLVKLFDPFLTSNLDGRTMRAEVINQTALVLDSDLLLNRALMIGVAASCLLILCRRFSLEERHFKQPATTSLALHEPAELLDRTGTLADDAAEQLLDCELNPVAPAPPLPLVTISLVGLRAQWQQFVAALGVEFRLLRSERSLIAVVPLVVLLCCLQLSPRGAAPDAIAYATGSTEALLLLLFGITLFYVGEALQRDQELRLTPLLWSQPAPDAVLLLAKFAAAFLLALALVLTVALAALALQLYRLPASIALRPYLTIYTIILLPSLIVMIGATITLHVLLRDKYLAHAAGLALGGGLLYLLVQGHTHWAYNLVLFGRWRYADLSGSAPFYNGIIWQRGYWLALTCAGLAAAHCFFPRCPTSSRSWTARLLVVALIIALILAILVSQSALSARV